MNKSKIVQTGDRPFALVVDDEVPIAEYIAACLRRAGYETVTAHTVADALELANTTKPRLAIIDVALGNESGFVLGNTLCERFKKLRVLYISGYVSQVLLLDGVPNNCRASFLQKVFTYEDLLEAIDRLERGVPGAFPFEAATLTRS